jgi:spermidine synthase
LKNAIEPAVVWVVVATGISSVATQLVAIREYLTLFQGNEFVIALILFSWLILGGLGTLIARWGTRLFFPVSAAWLGILSLALSALPAAQIHAIRHLRETVFIHGASVGFYPTLGFIFLTLAPYAALVGFVLPYSLFVLRRIDPAFPGARVYIADNFGDVAGGALFSFALVHLVSPLTAVGITGLPLIAATLILFRRSGRFGILVVGAALAAMAALGAGIGFERASLQPKTGELADYRESRYGRLTVHRDAEQVTLFEDGTPVYASQNLALAEEAVHFPMAQTVAPRRVLLISARGGMLAELAKYDLAGVDYLELNPEITEILFRFRMIRKIPGLQVVHQDGRRFLKGTNRRYDAIIVNLPEPATFQMNRFFTDRFYALARDRLAPGGVLGFAMAGFDNYLADAQREKLSCLYNTVSDHFAHVLLLPGQRTWFLCSDKALVKDIPARLKQKGIETRFVSRYFYGNLTTGRIDELNGLMDRNAPKNRDRSPQLMRMMFAQWFATFASSPAAFMGSLGLMCLIYLVWMGREEFVLFSTGCMTMGAEFLVIFAFQVFYGYIYLQIGLIVTVFLAGLLPGAWFGDRLRHRGIGLLRLTDALLVALLVVLVLGIHLGGDRLPVFFFLVFGFIVSLVCGFQFPVALHWIGGGNAAASRSFSADLMGAAAGSLLTSVVLMPYVGLVGAAAALIVLKLASIVVMGGDPR